MGWLFYPPTEPGESEELVVLWGTLLFHWGLLALEVLKRVDGCRVSRSCFPSSFVPFAVEISDPGYGFPSPV